MKSEEMWQVYDQYLGLLCYCESENLAAMVAENLEARMPDVFVLAPGEKPDDGA